LAVVAGLVVVILALTAVWLHPRLAGYYQRARQMFIAARKRYIESDRPAWRVLRGAAREGTLPRIIPVLYAWPDRNPGFEHPARLDQLDRPDHPVNPQIRTLIDAVAAHYSGKGETDGRYAFSQGAVVDREDDQFRDGDALFGFARSSAAR
jgi:hypothetical protein